MVPRESAGIDLPGYSGKELASERPSNRVKRLAILLAPTSAEIPILFPDAAGPEVEESAGRLAVSEEKPLSPPKSGTVSVE